MGADIVDPDEADFDPGGGAMGRLKVFGPDRGRQAVVDAIDRLEHLVLITPFEHGQDRSENLLLGDAHLR